MNRPPSIPEHAIAWDNHACMPIRPDDPSFLPQLARHRAAGFSIVILNVSFGDAEPGLPFRMLEQFRTFVGQHPDDYLLVRGVDDIHRAKRENKLGGAFDVEGGTPIQDTPERVADLYDLGVRWMLLTYNKNNRLAGGCQDKDGGLTAQGRKVIDVMRRVGMVLCGSHTGERSALEAMEYFGGPTIFSHSNPYAVHPHPRNISDRLIRACAERGGVINVDGIGIFLGNNDDSTEAYVRHVNYVADLAGRQHVGMGLDYVFDAEELNEYIRSDPKTFPPELGYCDGIRMIEPERLPAIAEALLDAGWSDDELLGFLGGNNLRVAASVWK
jgi:membrane dipeptidase